MIVALILVAVLVTPLLLVSANLHDPTFPSWFPPPGAITVALALLVVLVVFARRWIRFRPRALRSDRDAVVVGRLRPLEATLVCPVTNQNCLIWIATLSHDGGRRFVVRAAAVGLETESGSQLVPFDLPSGWMPPLPAVDTDNSRSESFSRDESNPREVRKFLETGSSSFVESGAGHLFDENQHFQVVHLVKFLENDVVTIAGRFRRGNLDEPYRGTTTDRHWSPVGSYVVAKGGVVERRRRLRGGALLQVHSVIVLLVAALLELLATLATSELVK